MIKILVIFSILISIGMISSSYASSHSESEMSEAEKQAREEIPNPCINIKEPQIDPKMQGDVGLNNPQYMEAVREAQYQYQQQIQHCLNEYQKQIDERIYQLPLNYAVDIEPLLDEGSALVIEKKYAEALMVFDQILEMTDHKIVQGQVFFHKGTTYQSMKEYETALQYYDKALEIEPTHSPSILSKGVIYQKTKQWQNSIDMFEQVLDYAGHNVSGYIEYSQERLDARQRMEEKSLVGGCLIATATYGTELASQVQQLRELRDNSLLQTSSGSAFMESFNQLYYSFSPTIADWERENPVFKEVVKLAITPLLGSLSILNYVEIDSDQEVLGYGISVILLNIGMYFVAPAIIIFKIRMFYNGQTVHQLRIDNGSK